MFHAKKVVEAERLSQQINGMLFFVELFVSHVVLIVIPERQVTNIHNLPPAFGCGQSFRCLRIPAHTWSVGEIPEALRGMMKPISSCRL
jgi:hypothetical protein